MGKLYGNRGMSDDGHIHQGYSHTGKHRPELVEPRELPQGSDPPEGHVVNESGEVQRVELRVILTLFFFWLCPRQ